MKWAIIAGSLMLPTFASAQSVAPVTPQDQIFGAKFFALTARQLVECGIRNNDWAKGVYIIAMSNTANAIDEIGLENLSVSQGTKIWGDLASAITDDPAMTGSTCAADAANTTLLGAVDKISASGIAALTQ